MQLQETAFLREQFKHTRLIFEVLAVVENTALYEILRCPGFDQRKDGLIEPFGICPFDEINKP